MAAVYAVVAWLLVQIIVSIEGPLGLPIWTDTLVIVLVALGFPVALVLAWAPEGVDPFFDSVRAERRFQKLLANVVREPS